MTRVRKPTLFRDRGDQAPSVAAGGARVGERLASLRDELPVVAARAQGELEHPVGVVVAHLAVGLRGPERGVVGPPVPTTNCLMPREAFTAPLGLWGANRS